MPGSNAHYFPLDCYPVEAGSRKNKAESVSYLNPVSENGIKFELLN